MIARIPRRKRIPVKRSTLKAKADRLWSLKVRNGWCQRAADEIGEGGYADAVTRCELAERHPAFPCAGPLQAAHGFSRRYLGTRFVPLNGFALCRSAHIYWTHRPLEWDAVLRAEWGETVYEELRQRALSFKGPLDYRLIADALR